MMVDFQSLLAMAEDPSIAAAKAGAVPFWGHLGRTGAVLDMPRGNVLWLDGNGCVSHAVHGRRVLTERQIKRIYGPNKGPLPVPGAPPAPSALPQSQASDAVNDTANGTVPSDAAGAVTADSTSPPADQHDEEDIYVLEARAKLRDALGHMPVGPFSAKQQAAAVGGAGSSSSASNSSAAASQFGVVYSGFDDSLPPLFALLVSRYDAWLRLDLSRRSADVSDIMTELEREQAEFEAGMLAAQLNGGSGADEGGHLPTVEEVDDEGDSESTVGRGSFTASPHRQISKRSFAAPSSAAAGGSTSPSFGATGSGQRLRASERQRSGSIGAASAGGGVALTPVHERDVQLEAEGERDDDSGEEGVIRGSVSVKGGASKRGGAPAHDDEDELEDDYDLFLRTTLMPFATASDGVTTSSGSGSSVKSRRAMAMQPVDYSFIAEAIQAAHRFVYSGYCNYGFHSLWRDLDSYVEKRPATKAFLQTLRKLPLPLLPAHPVQSPSLDAPAAASSPSQAEGAAVSALTGKSRRMRTFILTNSSWDHVAPALRHAYGPDWLDLFDAVFLEGRKRQMFAAALTCAGGGGANGIVGSAGAAAAAADGFSADDEEGLTAGGSSGAAARAINGRSRHAVGGGAPTAPPLRPVDAKTGRLMSPHGAGGKPLLWPSAAGDGATVADLSATKVWTGGSLSDVVATLKEHAFAPLSVPELQPSSSSSASAPVAGADVGAPLTDVRVVYVGDHVQQDIVGPAVAAGWATVAVLPGIGALTDVCGADGASAAGGPIDPRLLGDGISDVTRTQAAKTAVTDVRDHTLGAATVTSAEYHLRSIASGRYWRTPSLHASLALRHASLAVPSVEWLARALTPKLAAVQASSDKAAAGKLALIGVRGHASPSSGGSPTSPRATGAGAASAVLPAARRALIKNALSMRIGVGSILHLFRAPQPSAIVRACLVAARVPVPAAGISQSTWYRLFEVDARSSAAAAIATPSISPAATEAGAEYPSIGAVSARYYSSAAIQSEVTSGSSEVVEEVPAGFCGCFGGGGSKAKRAPSFKSDSIRASSTSSASAVGGLDDPVGSAADAREWLLQLPSPPSPLSPQSSEKVGRKLPHAGSLWPMDTPLNELQASGCWFVIVRQEKTVNESDADASQASSSSSSSSSGCQLMCGGRRDDTPDLLGRKAPPVWPLLAFAF